VIYPTRFVRFISYILQMTLIILPVADPTCETPTRPKDVRSLSTRGYWSGTGVSPDLYNIVT